MAPETGGLVIYCLGVAAMLGAVMASALIVPWLDKRKRAESLALFEAGQRAGRVAARLRRI